MSEPALKVGYWVALTLKAGTAPLRVYVGMIEAIDERGVRITLIDWISGIASSWDFFVPHVNIESALVGTQDHALDGFGKAAAEWQEKMEAKENAT